METACSQSVESIPLPQTNPGQIPQPQSHPQDSITLEFTGVNQASFDEKYGRIPPEKLTPKALAAKLRQKCRCSKECFLSGLRRYIPVIDLVATYKPRDYILGDVVAGVSIAVMQVPQSMGMALLANLPPIIGLYTSFFPVLVYFIFGRSRHNSIGTNAATSLIIASAISKGLPLLNTENAATLIDDGNVTSENSTSGTQQDEIDQEKIQIAMTVSLLAGLSLLPLALMKLGVIASYISDPFYSGFIAATNTQVLTYQLKHLLGIPVDSYSGPLSYFYTLRDICLNLKNTNIATMTISIIAILILVLVKKLVNERYAKRLKSPVPIDLIVVVIATIISYYCQFDSRFGVKIVKVIPQGLPKPTAPSMKDFDLYLMDGIMLGLINYVLVFIMVKMFADKHNYPYDANQELLATSLCAVSGSFFSSMAASTSPPRCILSEQTGGRTQLTQLISSAIMLLTLLFIAPLFQALPICILSTLIVVSSIPLFRYYKTCIEYWKTSKIDLAVWTISAIAIMLMGLDFGILIGLAASVLSVPIRTQLPYTSRMTLVPSDGYMIMMIDESKYECDSSTGSVVDGLALLRFEAPLYFATIDIFKNEVYSMTTKPADLLKQKVSTKESETNSQSRQNLDPDVGENMVDDKDKERQFISFETQHKNPQRLRAIVLDCSAMPFVDTAGAKTLAFLHNDYKRVGIRFLLANVVETVRVNLTRTKFCLELLASEVYPSVYDAIVASGLGTQGSQEGIEQ